MRRIAVVLSLTAPLVALAGTGGPLGAQGAPAATTAQAAPTPGARRAADELLRLMNVAQVLRAGFEVAFDEQLKAQPLMAPFRPTMQAWAEKYLTWEQYAPGLVGVYAEEFTEPELRALIAFYQTPVGRKAAALSPTLTRRGAAVGAAVAAAHTAELEQMIQARAVELQKSGALPGGGGGATGTTPPTLDAPR